MLSKGVLGKLSGTSIVSLLLQLGVGIFQL